MVNEHVESVRDFFPRLLVDCKACKSATFPLPVLQPELPHEKCSYCRHYCVISERILGGRPRWDSFLSRSALAYLLSPCTSRRARIVQIFSDVKTRSIFHRGDENFPRRFRCPRRYSRLRMRKRRDKNTATGGGAVSSLG